MIYLEIDENGTIIFQNNFPFHNVHGLKKTEEELLKTGYLVASVPEPEPIEGKVGMTRFNGTDFYFEYLDIPLTDSDRLSQLELELGDILLESAMDKAKINELELSQGDLLMEIALLKMGGVA